MKNLPVFCSCNKRIGLIIVSRVLVWSTYTPKQLWLGLLHWIHSATRMFLRPHHLGTVSIFNDHNHHFTMPNPFPFLLLPERVVEHFVHFKSHFCQYSVKSFKIIPKITVIILLILVKTGIKKNRCFQCPFFSNALRLFPRPQAGDFIFSDEKWNQQ